MKNADSQHNLSSIASRHLGAGRALPGIPKTWVACLLALATTIVGSNMACGQNPRGPLDVWTQVNTDIVIGVAGSPNTLVGVGGLGTVVTSTNGVDWSTQVSGVTSDLYTIVYGNGLFVAGGDAGTIITSADGVAWTSPLSNTTNAIYGLAFGNGNEILTSTDGVKWTVRPSTTPWGFSYIAFGSGRFTALAGPESSFLPYLSLVSTNGIDWSAAQRIYNLYDPAFLVFGDGIFVTVGSAENIDPVWDVSADGVNWKGGYYGCTCPAYNRPFISSPNFPYSPAAYGNGEFVAGVYPAGSDFSSLLISVDALTLRSDSAALKDSTVDWFDSYWVVRQTSSDPYTIRGLGFWRSRFVANFGSGIYLSGTLPPYLSQVSQSGNMTTVSMEGIPLESYVLQSAAIVNGPWQAVSTNTTSADGKLTFTDPTPPDGGSRFYRVSGP